MKTIHRILILIIIANLGYSVCAHAQNDVLRDALKFAMSTFNPTVSQSEYQAHIQYMANMVLSQDQIQNIETIYTNKTISAQELHEEILKEIAANNSISYVVMKDGSTYWSSPRNGQELIFNRDMSLRGIVEGEQTVITYDDMRQNLLSIEFSYPNPVNAIITRKDGRRFEMEEARFYVFNLVLNYKYQSSVTGSKQNIRLWEREAQRSDRDFIKMMVFGMQQPKMNPDNKLVYPPDYTYDPYDGTLLVPVEWEGRIHHMR